MASLKRRWGSGVMRHMDVFGEVLRECGRVTLRGFRRRWSVMNFFVARMSHIDSASERLVSEEVVSAARRFFVVDSISLCWLLALMCLRSALEALIVYFVSVTCAIVLVS